MNTSRRTVILGASALVPLALAGCAGTSTTTTPQAIVLDAQAAAQGFAGMFKSLTAQYPTLIPATLAAQIEKDAALASMAASTLGAGMLAATGAVTVAQVEAWINDGLNVLAGPPVNGLIPAPFNQVIGALAFLAPTLEAFASSFGAKVPVAASLRVGTMIAAAPVVGSRSQALAILRGAVKGA